MPEPRRFDRFARTTVAVVSDVGRLFCGGQSVGAAALEKPRIPDEVDVMRVIDARVKALSTAVPNVRLVGL